MLRDCQAACIFPWANNLVQPLGRSHGALDVETADVLPMLLEQGDQEVDGQMDVLHKHVLVHGHVADGHVQAEHLKRKGRI
jgi:hypothetical protein